MRTHQTHQILAPIRMLRRHDAKAVRELARMGHPDIVDEALDTLARNATEQSPDYPTTRLERKTDGTVIPDVPCLHSLRCIAPDDQKARALIHASPPLYWILSQRRRNLPVEDCIALAGALTEMQLIATHPRWRGRGYASRLLADAEDRYAAAGYRAAFVVLNPGRDDLRHWYTDRGYTLGLPDHHPAIQLRADRLHHGTVYDHLTDGQAIGIKALHPGVVVTSLGGLVHVRGLLPALATTEAHQ